MINKTIKSWRWRILRAGYANVRQFCENIGIPESMMSEYLTGKKYPSLKRFDLIEKHLKGIEEEKELEHV